MTQQLITEPLEDSLVKPIPFLNTETFERFLSKVSLSSPDMCWLWRGSLHSTGYGFFKLHGKNIKAHRLAYRLWRGEIPGGNVVLHSCDNPKCVNPQHLKCGNQRDNIADMDAKGRRADKYGEINGSAKFLPLDVAEIRAAHFHGEAIRSIARRYANRASRNAISNIVHRRTWTYGE